MSSQPEDDGIDEVLALLSANLNNASLSADDVEQYLFKIWNQGVSSGEKERKYSQQCIEVLCDYAFRPSNHLPDVVISRAALRCIEDALSSESVRQLFVDMDLPVQVVRKLETENGEYEYLVLSILFLLTHVDKLDFKNLIVEHDLNGQLIKCLRHYADIYGITLFEISRTSSETTADNMALIKVCKVIFNIIHLQPALSSSFDAALPSLVQLICRLPLPYPVLQPQLTLQGPLSTVIYCLTIFDFDLSAIDNVEQTRSVGDNPERISARDFVNRLIDILGLAVEQYNDTGLESTATPLVMLLRQTFPGLPPDLQQLMRASFLPRDGEGIESSSWPNLPCRLLELTRSMLAPTVRTSVAALLSQLSDSDPAQFSRSVRDSHGSPLSTDESQVSADMS